MTENGAPPEAPAAVRRLEDERATTLAALVEIFEDLQMVLRCCERLVTELGAEGEPDGVVIEAVWTMALLSYVRCFDTGKGTVALTEDDLTTVQPEGDVLEWHQVLVQLRDHHADPAANPRERFSVGATQGADGLASGVAITSAHQPLVDELTVRQTGAIGYGLSGLVNGRIETQQEKVFEELKGLTKEDLDRLATLDIAESTPSP